ncbi:MAG TPA: DUF5667 domain-containing protein [Actinomycetes bacterium]|jgi:hypothetical protein
MARPNQTHDRLDALLDGRPGEVPDDLAPLLAAAAALRGRLVEFELDPEVVNRHLEQALDRPATVVPLPVRDEGRGGGLRRQLVAVGLAAALVLVPATAASAASSSALPGQPLYPVKIAFEQFRLAAVQWSATAEAHERTRLAAIRLKELDKLIQLRMVRQIPHAIRALDQAVVAAHAAVEKAIAEEGAEPELVAAASKLEAVKDAKSDELVALRKIVSQLPPANQAAIKLAVQQSQVITASLPPVLAPAPATTAASNTTAPSNPGSGGTPSSGPAVSPTSVATTQPEQPQPSASTTTEAPGSTTTTSPPTEPPTTAGSQGNSDGAGNGVGSEGTPPSSGP